MRHVSTALFWESFQIGFRTNIWFAIFTLIFPACFFGLLQTIIRGDEDTEVITLVVRLVIGINSFCIAMFAIDDQPKLSHHAILPIKTSTIVIFRMVFAACRAGVMSIVYGGVVNLLFHLNLTIWGPVLFTITLSELFLATHWACEKTVWKPLILCVPVIPIYFLYIPFSIRFSARFGTLTGQSTTWTDPNWLDLLMMGVSITASYFSGHYFVTRNRCGDHFYPDLHCEELFNRIRFSRTAPTAFPSPQAAQLWYYWRQFGWSIPVMTILALIAIAAGFAFERDPQAAFEMLIASGCFMVIATFVPATVLGVCNTSSALNELPQFLATRPVTNWQISTSIFYVFAKSILIGWILWLTPVLIFQAWAAVSGVRLEPREFSPGFLVYLGVLLGTWVSATVLSSILSTGRPWLFVLCFFVPLVADITLVLLLDALVVEETKRWAWGMVQSAIGLGLMIAAGQQLISAVRSGQIRWRIPIICSSFWIALSVAFVVVLMAHHVQNVSHYLLGCGLAALVVMPFGSLPLAIAWNRAR